MHSIDWFQKPRARPPEGGVGAAALKAAVGLGVGALFYVRGHVVLAAVAGGLAALFFAVSLSPAGRAALAKGFAALGEWLGRVVGTVLLSAIFLLVLTPVRALRRLAGADDLRLRDGHERSYWLVCDDEEHKRRYAGAMFATEVRAEGGGRRWVALLAAAAALLVASEIGLRARGHGRPPVYVSDPSSGYHLAPGQATTWRGARFETNRFGMRAPERDPKKPQGALRVLTLGTDGGLRIDQEALFGRVLERRLAEGVAGRAPGAIEVWNADVAGWGPASMRGYVELFGTFEADVAVLVLAPGALEQPKQSLLYTPFFPADRPPRLALEETLLDLLWQYRDSRTPPSPEYTRTMRGMGADDLRGLLGMLGQRGAPPLLVIAAPIEPLPAHEKAPFLWAIGGAPLSGGRATTMPASFVQTGIDAGTSALTVAGHAALAEVIEVELLEHSPKVRAWLGGNAQ